MIPVRRPRSNGILSKDCRDDLARRQVNAAGLARRDPGIKTAWDNFGKSKAREELVTVLKGLFHEKCAYCENIIARDIEHFYPKSLYPQTNVQVVEPALGVQELQYGQAGELPVATRKAGAAGSLP